MQTHLACISPVDDLDPFLSCQAVHVDLVGVPAAMPLLLGSTILEVELHLHLIYPLRTRWKQFWVKMFNCSQFSAETSFYTSFTVKLCAVGKFI